MRHGLLCVFEILIGASNGDLQAPATLVIATYSSRVGLTTLYLTRMWVEQHLIASECGFSGTANDDAGLTTLHLARTLIRPYEALGTRRRQPASLHHMRSLRHPLLAGGRPSQTSVPSQSSSSHHNRACPASTRGVSHDASA